MCVQKLAARLQDLADKYMLEVDLRACSRRAPAQNSLLQLASSAVAFSLAQHLLSLSLREVDRRGAPQQPHD